MTELLIDPAQDFGRRWLDSMGNFLGISTWPEPPDAVPLRILGLAERPASQDEVKSAFRARLAIVHPDVAAYRAVPALQSAADAIAAQRPEVAELVWARDVMLRKIPPAVTANNVPECTPTTRNGWPRSVCPSCEREITGWPDLFASSRRRWGNHCEPCAEDAELARQRDLRRQRRADRACESCGATFTPPRSDGRYCSPACRQRAYRQRPRRALTR